MPVTTVPWRVQPSYQVEHNQLLRVISTLAQPLDTSLIIIQKEKQEQNVSLMLIVPGSLGLRGILESKKSVPTYFSPSLQSQTMIVFSEPF